MFGSTINGEAYAPSLTRAHDHDGSRTVATPLTRGRRSRAATAQAARAHLDFVDPVVVTVVAAEFDGNRIITRPITKTQVGQFESNHIPKEIMSGHPGGRRVAVLGGGFTRGGVEGQTSVYLCKVGRGSRLNSQECASPLLCTQIDYYTTDERIVCTIPPSPESEKYDIVAYRVRVRAEPAFNTGLRPAWAETPNQRFDVVFSVEHTPTVLHHTRALRGGDDLEFAYSVPAYFSHYGRYTQPQLFLQRRGISGLDVKIASSDGGRDAVCEVNTVPVPAKVRSVIRSVIHCHALILLSVD